MSNKKKLKSIIIFGALIFISLTLSACKEKIVTDYKNKDTIMTEYKDKPLAFAKYNGKWGILNTKGNWVVEPNLTFGDIRYLGEGVYYTNVPGEKSGFIDKFANWLGTCYSFDPYDDPRFSCGLIKIVKNGKYGYANEKGEIVIEPKYKSAEDFSEDIARVVSEDDEHMIKYINTKGEVLFEIEDKNRFEYINPFKEGLMSKENDRGLCGYINIKGEWVIEPKYVSAYDFSEGLAFVEGTDYSGYINKNGELVLKFDANVDMGWNFSEGIASLDIFNDSNLSESKDALIDKKGNYIIPFTKDLSFTSNFKEGLMPFYDMKIKKYGYINTTGQLIIDPNFDLALEFFNGLASIKINDKWGFVDNDGNIIDAKFQLSTDFIK